MQKEGWRVLTPSDSGEPFQARLTLPPRVIPSALCFDRLGRLLVADRGPGQQIRIYDPTGTTSRLAGVLGKHGGILSPPRGAFGDWRLNDPTGIGADADGNIYVASSGSVDGGSTVLECYAPNAKLLWRRLGLTFVDLADAAPRGAADRYADVFTKEERFRLDLSRPAGQEWSYAGYTVDRYRYPDDPRLHTSPTNAWVRILQGQRFLFVTDMTAEFLSIYRFHPSTDGEIAIPCALFAHRHVDLAGDYPPYQPARGEWIWIDRNGNGRIDPGEYVSNGGADSQGILAPDDRGDLWQATGAGIRVLPCLGISPRGIPLWDFAHAHLYPKPAEFDEVRRIQYLPDRDRMILGGNHGEDHNQHWKPMGPVLCEYSSWSSRRPRLERRIVLPYQKGSSGHESAELISFSAEGDYLFVAYTRGLAAEGLKNAFVRVLRLSDLSWIGNLTAEAELGETGLLDLVESVAARRRANGEYLVFLEDDMKAKVLLFRWKPG